MRVIAENAARGAERRLLIEVTEDELAQLMGYPSAWAATRGEGKPTAPNALSVGATMDVASAWKLLSDLRTKAREVRDAAARFGAAQRMVEGLDQILMALVKVPGEEESHGG